jgi:hypothetical protein
MFILIKIPPVLRGFAGARGCAARGGRETAYKKRHVAMPPGLWSEVKSMQNDRLANCIP